MQRELEYIYTVYKTGSFSKAGELLYASQPTVSMAVHRMEENLGYQIFERGTQPLRLTEAGKLLIEHIERIRDSEQLLQHGLDMLSTRTHIPLRIGCTPMHASCIFPKVIAQFRRKAPEIEIDVESAFPQQLVEMLKRDELDLVLSTMTDTQQTELVFTHAFNVQYLLAVPAPFPINDQLEEYALRYEDIRNNRHLEAQVSRVPLSCFAGVPFVTLKGQSDFYSQSKQIFAESSFTPNSQLSVTTPSSAYQMCRNGFGATLVGSFSIESDEDVIYYRLMSRKDERPFYFISRKDFVMSPELELFIEEFKLIFQI